MLANRVNGAVATVVLAAAVLAHAAAAAIFALDSSATVLTNAAATTVFAKTLQSPVFANVLPGTASPLHDVILVPTAAASILLVRALEIGETAEDSGGADQGADGGIFLYGIRVFRRCQNVHDIALRHNVDKVSEERYVRLFSDGLDLCRHCQGR
jgi:hypothetical protein